MAVERGPSDRVVEEVGPVDSPSVGVDCHTNRAAHSGGGAIEGVNGAAAGELGSPDCVVAVVGPIDPPCSWVDRHRARAPHPVCRTVDGVGGSAATEWGDSDRFVALVGPVDPPRSGVDRDPTGKAHHLRWAVQLVDDAASEGSAPDCVVALVGPVHPPRGGVDHDSPWAERRLPLRRLIEGVDVAAAGERRAPDRAVAEAGPVNAVCQRQSSVAARSSFASCSPSILFAKTRTTRGCPVRANRTRRRGSSGRTVRVVDSASRCRARREGAGLRRGGAAGHKRFLGLGGKPQPGCDRLVLHDEHRVNPARVGRRANLDLPRRTRLNGAAAARDPSRS